MKLNERVLIIKKMTQLIENEITGNADQFSKKLQISRGQLFDRLQDIRNLDVEIDYSRCKKSFYFSGNKRIKVQPPILVFDIENAD